ncbi:hypothetical protein ACLB2K_026071 [Fragaria x ananassa]
MSKFSKVQQIGKFSLGNLSLSLEDLDISMCNMRGNIPDEMGNLTSLTLFNFGTQSIAGINSNYNGKTGESPSLELLDLSKNNLSGVIPKSLEAILHLQYLNLSFKEKFLQNSSMNILQRLNIIIDVASALEYHHHGYEIPIVHRDVKSGNILLDEDMVAHVADFGTWVEEIL